MRKYVPWLIRLLGPLLLLVFLLNSNLDQLLTILLQAAPGPILLSLVLMPPFLLIKAWRWRQILRELGLDISLRSAMGVYTVGVYLGAVTPGQAGDLVKAWYVREQGQPMAPAVLSVVVDRLCDLMVMVAFAAFGLLAVGQLVPGQGVQLVLVGGLGVGVVVATGMLVSQASRRWLFTCVLPVLLPRQVQASLQRWHDQLATLAMHPRFVGGVLLASLLSAGFTFYRLWLLFLALSITIPLHIVVGVSALIAVLQIAPVSIAGVGVRDAALLAVLIPYGYIPEQALSLSVLFLLLNIEHVVVGFIVSFWYPMGRRVETPVSVDQSVS